MKALENGWLEDAIPAFTAAKVQMPVDGLIVCGTKALYADRPGTAMAAFRIAAALELGQSTS